MTPKYHENSKILSHRNFLKTSLDMLTKEFSRMKSTDKITETWGYD